MAREWGGVDGPGGKSLLVDPSTFSHSTENQKPELPSWRGGRGQDRVKPFSFINGRAKQPLRLGPLRRWDDDRERIRFSNIGRTRCGCCFLLTRVWDGRRGRCNDKVRPC